MVDHIERILDEQTVPPDPITEFKAWYDEATAVQPILPNAMSLATATPDGKPSVRIVLLKSFDAHGFVFYTNYNSRKSKELALNPNVELAFWWPMLEHQVRIEGVVEKVSSQESDEYFQTRPRESQIGAHASPQSDVIATREELDRRMEMLEKQFAGKLVPRPPHWGGYRVKPSRIEFWQGRQSRLHDRIVYTLRGNGSWKIQRLAP
ncbi:MAG: pyridoxamine 5'-phosphate oxidase [Ignavibacteriae bacterium]|nr:pyridoxamine 5'-phosphate oxidase [Ignavibacteria bacterium]MBI3363380.1 pyridoxamine 5'-phosphate oxidase [Ignavibacteriota bacterium]